MSIAETAAEPAQPDAATLARAIAAKAPAEGFTYSEVLREAERRGYAPFILFAAVLLLLPIDFVLHQVTAITLIVCGAGLFFGASAPWLPGFIGKRKADKAALEKLANFLQGQQAWTHLLLSPRHPEFSLGVGEKAAAIGLILLGLSIAGPLPDVIPALGAIAIGLGLLQRDGLVMMIGTAVAFGWAAFLVTMIAGLILGAPFAGGWIHDNASWLADLLAPSKTGGA